MIVSMTGFASGRGEGSDHNWVIDIRSVNGKGLDIKLRVPDWIDGLEAAVRAAIVPRVARGNVNLTIKLARTETALAADLFRSDPAAVRSALQVLALIEAEAMRLGVTLAQATPADIMGLRGVLGQSTEDITDPTTIRAAVLASLSPVIDAFCTMRAAEGQALSRVIGGQLDQIGVLVAQAEVEAAARRQASSMALRDGLSRILSAVDQPIDEARIAQEIAMMAVKSDIMEEIDRLKAHVDAARDLIASPDPVGRKLDFLTQEFMREANTLCSKSQSLALTRIGLDLKTLIDQMREQVQNVE